MKFKTLFFLFNLILFLSFAFIFLMPLPVLGWEYALSFWRQNWPIAAVFVAILIVLDAYFVSQWPVYRRLEREDWAGLATYLEGQLKKRGRLGLTKTRIFLNALLIQQRPQDISVLREKLVANKVRFVPKIALHLGLPLVLKGDAEGIEAFFGPLVESRATGPDRPWIEWCLAFGRLLRQDPEGARPLLEKGLTARQPLLRLLSLYLLDNVASSNRDVALRVQKERQRLAAEFTEKEWRLQIEAWKEKVILIVFMEKLIGDAQAWLSGAAKENRQ